MSSVRAKRRPAAPREDEGATPGSRRPRLSVGRLSIRLRLTLLYSAILALALILFGGMVYTSVQGAMMETARTALLAEAHGLDVGHLMPGFGAPSASGGSTAVPSAGSGAVVLAPGPDTYVQVRAYGGRVLGRSSNLKGATLPLTLSALTRVQHGDPADPIVVSIAGQRLLVYSFCASADHGPGPNQGQGQGPPSPGQNQSQGQGANGPIFGQGGGGNTSIFGQGRPSLIIQVAQSLAGQDHVLALLRVALLGGGPVVILLAFGVGWLLAGTALRPIARLTRTAQAIGASRDFGRRVAHSGPRDEVGRLATTFNTMLAGLQEAYQALQEAYQAQRRFVGDASHELRTPLTTIRGNLGLLQREPPIAEADRVAVLADLVSESERLSRLVGDLLTLARSDAGRALRQEPVPVAPLLAGLLRRLAATYPGRAIYEEGRSDATVLGDPDALTQVLLILLDNALKFTPPDGTVAVVTSVDGDRVSIAVRDTGPGIAPKDLPHIFERFYQGDAARAGTGTGLGLAIAQALVERQGGAIGVESRPGAGSAFTVTLPRAATAPQATLVHASGE